MRPGVRVFLLTIATATALAGCDDSKDRGRPVPTPGPQIVVGEVGSRLGGSVVERGERVRFAVTGTGTGTHFDAGTFLHSPAFTSLSVTAVESPVRLLAQGTVSLAAGEGNKDIAAVSGDELAVEPWAFRVVPTTIVNLGKVPCSSDGSGGDANVLDPAGDFDVYAIYPPTDAVLTLLVEVELASGAPAAFRPSLELYSTDGRLLAASDHRCVSAKVRSRAPVYARVGDPGAQGGADRRYRVAAAFGLPDACIASSPGDLPPSPAP